MSSHHRTVKSLNGAWNGTFIDCSNSVNIFLIYHQLHSNECSHSVVTSSKLPSGPVPLDFEHDFRLVLLHHKNLRPWRLGPCLIELCIFCNVQHRPGHILLLWGCWLHEASDYFKDFFKCGFFLSPHLV